MRNDRKFIEMMERSLNTESFEKEKLTFSEKIFSLRIRFWRVLNIVSEYVRRAVTRFSWYTANKGAALIVREQAKCVYIDPVTGAVAFDKNRLLRLAGISQDEIRSELDRRKAALPEIDLGDFNKELNDILKKGGLN